MNHTSCISNTSMTLLAYGLFQDEEKQEKMASFLTEYTDIRALPSCCLIPQNSSAKYEVSF